MDSKTDNLEYEVLGFKLRMKPSEDDGTVTPDEVVKKVRDEANKIADKLPHLDRGQVAILAALKIAQDHLNLEQEYRDQIDHLHNKADSALQFIEEVSPTTV